MNAQTDIQVRHIPGSLKLLSYLYFLNGVLWVALAILVVGLDLLNVGRKGDNHLAGVWVFGLVVGLFSIGLSRGLRRGSRGWRIFALLLAWIGLVASAYKGYLMFAPHLQNHPYPKPPELTTPAIAALVGTLLLQLWQLRVLTRADVTDFFDRRS